VSFKCGVARQRPLRALPIARGPQCRKRGMPLITQPCAVPGLLVYIALSTSATGGTRRDLCHSSMSCRAIFTALPALTKGIPRIRTCLRQNAAEFPYSWTTSRMLRYCRLLWTALDCFSRLCISPQYSATRSRQRTKTSKNFVQNCPLLFHGEQW
jgi:hypothetical protein